MLKNTILSAVQALKVAVQDLAVDAVLVTRLPQAHTPGVATQYTESNANIKLVLTKYKLKEIDGERIRAGDYQGIVFPETVVPNTNDVIKIGVTDTWRIVNVDRIMVGTDVALSTCQLRRT